MGARIFAGPLGTRRRIARALVLLVLAIALPLEGVVAATMAIGMAASAAASSPHAIVASGDDDSALEGGHDCHPGSSANDARAHGVHAPADPADDAPSTACGPCSFCCIGAALIASGCESIAGPPPRAGIAWAADVPRCEFLTDGPHRPPRTRSR